MAKLVSMPWVADRLGRAEFTILDPRRPMKYLSGHLPGALNLPIYKTFNRDGWLIAPELLADLLGKAGLSDDSTPVVYDSPEGQNGAMLAWILEYLGRTDVHLMECFFEAWKASVHEVLYKPVEPSPQTFTARVNCSVRATLDEVRNARGITLVDFRSSEEYAGSIVVGDDRPGHIPGSVNIAWRLLGTPPQHLLKPVSDLAAMTQAAGLKSGDRVVAYCRSGPRAALGYLALREIGLDVRLFDGSFAQWTQVGLPVEQ
jgi:thiosulfate/3-mercaptopyruvate sulfurtransferase